MVAQVLSGGSVIARELCSFFEPRSAGLVYIGQGRIGDRVRDHLGKTEGVQANIFGAGPVAVSWVANETWLAHQRLELENDLIAAFVIATESVPLAQFVG